MSLVRSCAKFIRRQTLIQKKDFIGQSICSFARMESAVRRIVPGKKMFVAIFMVVYHAFLAFFRNLIVFRNQLPRKNDFYDYEPPVETEATKEVPSPVNLCQVCGCRGPLFCGKCKAVSYCGQQHQKIDWRGSHKERCGKPEDKRPANDFVFPEFEIVLDQEEEVGFLAI